MSEHPHQGLIAAVAYLSDMYAKSFCASEALAEHGDPFADLPYFDVLRRHLEHLADQLMEPCGVAHILQAIEKVLATEGVPAGLAFKSANENGRAEIVRWLVDGRQAAYEDGDVLRRVPDDAPAGLAITEDMVDRLVERDCELRDADDEWIAAVLEEEDWARHCARELLKAALAQAGSGEGHTLVPNEHLAVLVEAANDDAHQQRADGFRGPDLDRLEAIVASATGAARGGRPRWPETEGASA